jgi:tetratricopeptide (TPR) repeat protein
MRPLSMVRAGRIRFATASLLALAVVGCSSDTWNRYRAERMVWKANMTVRRLKVNPVVASTDDYEKAMKAFEEVADRFPAPAVHDTSEIRSADRRLLARISGRALIQAARLRSERRQTEKALTLCDRVLKDYAFDQPLCLEAQYTKGRVLEGNNQIGRAIEEYEKLIAEYPPSVRGGDVPIQQVLALPVRIAEYYQSVGDTAHASARFDEARAYYQRVIDQYPRSSTSAVARLKLGTTYSDQGRYADAIGVLEQMSSEPAVTEDQAAEIAFTIGTLYENGLKNHPRSLEAFDRVLREHPQSAMAGRAQLMIGTVNREMGNAQKAIDAFKKTRTDYPSDLESGAAAEFQIAQIYEEQDSWPQALEEYTATSADYPKTRYGLLAPLVIAQHYRREGDKDAAKLALDRAVATYHEFMAQNAQSPLAAVAQDYVAQARMMQENWPEAVEELVRYGDRYSESANAAIALLSASRICVERLGNRERAGDILRKIASRYPNTPVARQAESELQKLDQAG